MDRDSEESTVSLSPREQRRGVVLNQLLGGTLSSEQAAVLLGVSIRQLRRLKSRYQADGPAGLVHGNRGRQPWLALAPEVRARVLDLAQHKYAGLNQQHLTEKLHDEGLHLGRTTVCELLLRSRRYPRVLVRRLERVGYGVTLEPLRLRCQRCVRPLPHFSQQPLGLASA
jgi:transposase